MNVIDKIINLCTLSSDKIDSKNEYFHKAIAFNFYSFISLFLLLVFSVINILQGNMFLFVALAVLFVANSVNLILFRTHTKYLVASKAFLVLLSAFLLWLLYTGVINNQGITFYAFYPAIAILILGKKQGNISAIIFIVISGITILFPDFLNFSIASQILFLFLYALCFTLVNLYINLIETKFAELNIEIQKAKHETQAKEEFISKISHQIRTPLNNLVVVTNIVNDSNLDEKQRDLIDTIQASTNNLVNVVNNIAEISNVDLLAAATAATRKLLVGSGDRSERIRTYNFPQGRLTDHRINLTLYKLGEILEGGLDQVIDPLVQEHQAELLAAQADT